MNAPLNVLTSGWHLRGKKRLSEVILHLYDRQMQIHFNPMTFKASELFFVLINFQRKMLTQNSEPVSERLAIFLLE
jgi:hypothetical protein